MDRPDATPLSAADPVLPLPGSRLTGLRVLIAEDEADTAFSTAILLQLDGHAVEVARTGPEVLAAVAASDPHVVLLDIGLPQIDGCEVAKRIKARHALKTPLLVAMTGYGSEADRHRSAEAGIDLHFVKPVDPELLRDLLKRFARVVAEG